MTTDVFLVQRRRPSERVWTTVINAIGNPVVSTIADARRVLKDCHDAEPCKVRIVRIVGEIVEDA